MRLFSKKRPKGLDRQRAFTARPEQLPVVSRKETDNGGLSLRVRLTPRAWLRWLKGSEQPVERTFNLDHLGREVYEACDGKTNVKAMIRNFAKAHNISVAEAEISVSTFLRTLVQKGIVAIAIDRKEHEKGGR